MPLRSLCVAACLSIATPFLSFHFADHLGSLTLFRAMLAFISMCRTFDMLDEHKATSTCMATRSEVPLVFILLKANSSAPPPLFLCVSCFTVLCLSSGTLFYLASRFYFAKNRFSVLPLFDVTAGVRRGRGSGPHAGLSCFSRCKLFLCSLFWQTRHCFFWLRRGSYLPNVCCSSLRYVIVLSMCAGAWICRGPRLHQELQRGSTRSFSRLMRPPPFATAGLLWAFVLLWCVLSPLFS